MTNLKEIVVAFDASVDKATVEDHDSYTGKSVRLTLDAPNDAPGFDSGVQEGVSSSTRKRDDTVTQL